MASDRKIKLRTKRQQATPCLVCGAAHAHDYQNFARVEIGDYGDEDLLSLCVRCARSARTRKKAEATNPASGFTRDEWIAALDRFFDESGGLEICRRCHKQGTGCCPSSCRALGDDGCRRKNLWCATFACGALTNAIAECDAEMARVLRWAKREIGAAEFRVYEMMTRVPKAYREPMRPLHLPQRYPQLTVLDGQAIREQLLALSENVLEVRRAWHEEEINQAIL